MQVVDGGVRYVVRDNVSGRKKTVHTQAALMSIGRVRHCFIRSNEIYSLLFVDRCQTSITLAWKTQASSSPTTG